MKVLWVCNVPNADACKHLGITGVNIGGWLTGLSNSLKKSDIDLVYCYPKLEKPNQDIFEVDNIKYYSFYAKSKWGINANCDTLETREQIAKILSNENPDVIHIFGTEYVHSYIFYQLAADKEIICCSIQGLTSIIAKHYLSLIPFEQIRRLNLSCIVKGTLKRQQKRLAKRGETELLLLSQINHIIGRTDWDKACSHFMNPSAIYHKCNETLRSGFYENKWTYEKCKKFRIFVSQASSPVKGLNVLLEAVSMLISEYPEVEIHIAGNDFLNKNSIIKKLKYSTYAAYIDKIMNNGKIADRVFFCGSLSEEQMIKEYLDCNVFVSPSSIENSSNSIGEAMLLGCPVISSDVGGIKTLLKHEEEGLIYQADAPYMLAYNIKRMFDMKENVSSFGESARKKASITHSKVKNREDLIQIYEDIHKERILSNI